MDTSQNKEFLATAPIGRLLRKLAVPTVLAQLVNMCYNIVDRIYIGRMPEVGDLALTGVGLCMPIILIVSAFAALFSGGAPRASIFMGQRRMDDAEAAMGGCFAMQIVASVVLTAALLLWNRDFLMAFGGSPYTIGYAVDYMNLYAVGTIFVQLTLGMNAFIAAQGFTRTAMCSVVIGAACNIVLDPLFIYVLGMGVRGAALATVISQTASCIWVLSFLFGKKTNLRLRWRNIRLRPRVVLPCVALGTASFIMQSSESIVSMCFNASLQRYGGDIAVGAMTILTAVMQFAMLPLQGLGQGAQPILSYNYGAGNKQRVKEAFFCLLKVSLGYSLFLCALVELFPQLFVGLFTPDPALTAFASRALRIYMGGVSIFGLQVACQMAFLSFGKALSSITVAVVRKFILLLPLIYLMPRFVEDKTMGVYLAEPVADVLAVCFTGVLFFFQFRKVLREMK
ncbi:MAG: MATE family efflux transporter [Oscillospiraceae bacterium]|nr:MATE family efflux transporter [Oscillospiraceae bacterium]